MLTIEGQKKESLMFFLVFGNNYTEENLNYLLASIEDNGVEIPDMAFGYTPETLNFLKGKDVFIKVEMKPYKEEMQPTITTFLTLQEFEESGEEAEDTSMSDDW